MAQEILEQQDTKEREAAFLRMKETLAQFFSGAMEKVSEKLGCLNEGLQALIHDWFFKVYELKAIGIQSLGRQTILHSALQGLQNKTNNKKTKKKRKLISP